MFWIFAMPLMKSDSSKCTWTCRKSGKKLRAPNHPKQRKQTPMELVSICAYHIYIYHMSYVIIIAITIVVIDIYI